MDTWVIITIVIIAAIVLTVILWYGAVWMRLVGLYTNANITKVIKAGYAETGKNPNDLRFDKIVQISGEDKDGNSIFDVVITFASGENSGKTIDFRYFLTKMPPKEGVAAKLVVASVEPAPAPIK